MEVILLVEQSKKLPKNKHKAILRAVATCVQQQP